MQPSKCAVRLLLPSLRRLPLVPVCWRVSRRHSLGSPDLFIVIVIVIRSPPTLSRSGKCHNRNSHSVCLFAFAEPPYSLNPLMCNVTCWSSEDMYIQVLATVHSTAQHCSLLMVRLPVDGAYMYVCTHKKNESVQQSARVYCTVV